MSSGSSNFTPSASSLTSRSSRGRDSSHREWVGPRNLSTAMMRSFGSRSDTFVSDEPFYGCFLEHSGADIRCARR